jgi:2-amino-4-hydroxy-6-hydroxymethyldihydropteridine diphosphokinase
VGPIALSGAPVEAFIALGGNVGDVLASFCSALEQLAAGEVTVLSVSSAYRTAALVLPGSDDARVPDYWNAVIAVSTRLTARGLLALCLDIEARPGRVRRERWAPRAIDLDVLTYGDHCIDEPDLVVPHPRIAERLFVLRPLCEIAPQARIPPDGITVTELLTRHADANTGIHEVRREWCAGASPAPPVGPRPA